MRVMALCARCSCCRDDSPYSQPLLTSVRLLYSICLLTHKHAYIILHLTTMQHLYSICVNKSYRVAFLTLQMINTCYVAVKHSRYKIIRLLSQHRCTHSISIVLRPQNAPSSKRTMPFLCMFKDWREWSPLKVKLLIRRNRFRLRSLPITRSKMFSKDDRDSENLRIIHVLSHLQVLKVAKLKGLGRNGVQTVPVQSQHQQGVGQIFKAVWFQCRYAVVIQKPEKNMKMKLRLASLEINKVSSSD